MDDDGRASLAVVIPTLGRPSLRAALEALAAQEDAEAFGVVVVHGPEIGEEQVRALVPAAFPPRLAIIEVSERSVGARRNAGAAAAPGAWLAFTDDDCRVPPRWAACLARYCRSHPDVDIAGGAVVEPVRQSPIYSFMRRINYMAGPATMKVRPDGIPSLGAANLL
ncbi:MAG TPA: glycosyltransferase, partial [Candidatus Limnocylindrales bacterium]|nr:glycosyltransferase [Candidatus Limnocylindrales bacterium]